MIDYRILVVLLSFILVLVPSANGQEIEAQTVLELCSDAMAEPMQYRVRTRGTEWTVSRNANGFIRMEFSAPGITTAYLIRGQEVYEILPKTGTVLDASIKREQILGLAKSFNFSYSDIVNVAGMEDAGEHYTFSVRTIQGEQTLKIAKSSKHLIERTGSSSKDQTVSFFDFSVATPSDDLFRLPDSSSIIKPTSAEEYQRTKTSEITKAIRRDTEPQSELAREDHSIPGPPAGVSNEQWARMIGEEIGRVEAPKHMTKEQVERLSEAWKKNSSLETLTVNEVPPSSDADGAPSFGIWGALGLAVAALVCLTVFVWRARNTL